MKATKGGELPFVFAPETHGMETASGLLADYKRLLDYEAGCDVLKLLVLVLDTRQKDGGAFGKVIPVVEFEGPAVIAFKTPSVTCKVWEIRGRAGGDSA